MNVDTISSALFDASQVSTKERAPMEGETGGPIMKSRVFLRQAEDTASAFTFVNTRGVNSGEGAVRNINRS